MNELEEFEFRDRMEREARAPAAVAPMTGLPNSLADKMNMARAAPAESLLQYAGRFAREGALPALGATAGTAIGGVPGAMAGAALGETVSQATGLTPAGSVFPEANTPDLGRVAITGAMQGVVPAAAWGAKKLMGAGKALLNPVKAATLGEGQAAGYVVPPSAVNPSALNNRLESIAGKAAVGQEAAKRNQAVTNALAAKSLGLPKETTLTPEVLSDFRTQQGKVYEEVASLSDTAKTALNELKQARHDSKVQWNFYNRSGNPEALSTAKNADAMAEMFTDELTNEAKNAGRSDLIKALTEARVKIAKSFDVSRALNASSGEVNAPTLGKIFAKRGEKAVTEELGTIGKMAGAFPQAMREGGRVPASGVSGTDAAASALLGTVGYGAGGPAGMLAAGLPLLRGPARNLVLSPSYQRFATQGLSPQRQAMIDALMRRGAPITGAVASQMVNEGNAP